MLRFVCSEHHGTSTIGRIHGYTGNRPPHSGSGFTAEDFWSGELHPEAVVGPETT